jgi:hypothetical protein
MALLSPQNTTSPPRRKARKQEFRIQEPGKKKQEAEGKNKNIRGKQQVELNL